MFRSGFNTMASVVFVVYLGTVRDWNVPVVCWAFVRQFLWERNSRTVILASAAHPLVCCSAVTPARLPSSISFLCLFPSPSLSPLTCSSSSQGSAPPILSFNMGSLGFLTAFDASQWEVKRTHTLTHLSHCCCAPSKSECTNELCCFPNERTNNAV